MKSPACDPGQWPDAHRSVALLVWAAAVAVLCGVAGLYPQFVQWRTLDGSLLALKTSVEAHAAAGALPLLEGDLAGQERDPASDETHESTTVLPLHEMLGLLHRAIRDHGLTLERFYPTAPVPGGPTPRGTVTIEASGRFSALMGLLQDLAHRPEILIATKLQVALPALSDSVQTGVPASAMRGRGDPAMPRDLLMRLVVRGSRSPRPVGPISAGHTGASSDSLAGLLQDSHPFHGSARMDLFPAQPGPSVGLAAHGVAELQMRGSMSWGGQHRAVVGVGDALHVVGVGEIVAVERLRVMRIDEHAIALGGGQTLQIRARQPAAQGHGVSASTGPGSS